MGLFGVRKGGGKLAWKHKGRQPEDLVVDELWWPDCNEECESLREQGYLLSWKNKREVSQALEEGREYFTVTDHRQRVRRVRFDDEKSGPLYLMMKKRDDG